MCKRMCRRAALGTSHSHALAPYRARYVCPLRVRRPRVRHGPASHHDGAADSEQEHGEHPVPLRQRCRQCPLGPVRYVPFGLAEHRVGLCGAKVVTSGAVAVCSCTVRCWWVVTSPSPAEPRMASVTTDEGVLHVFDIRSHLRTSAVLYDVKKAVRRVSCRCRPVVVA